jgi:hypothetical protein
MKKVVLNIEFLSLYLFLDIMITRSASNHLQQQQQQKKSIEKSNDEVQFLEVLSPKYSGGWLQVNDYRIPFINIKDQVYKLNEGFMRSIKYVPLEFILQQNLLTSYENLTSITTPNKEQVEFLNKLVCTLDKTDEILFKYDLLKLVNIYEVIYEAKKTIFLKKLQPKVKVFKDYHDVLTLRGGLLLVLDKNIIPFVLYQKKKITTNGCMLDFPDKYYVTKNSKQFLATMELTALFREFYELVVFYICIEQTFQDKLKLLDVTSLCDMYPNDLKILCTFTNKFPMDWKYSIKNIITTRRDNNNNMRSMAPNFSSNISATTTKEINNHEAISMSKTTVSTLPIEPSVLEENNTLIKASVAITSYQNQKPTTMIPPDLLANAKRSNNISSIKSKRIRNNSKCTFCNNCKDSHLKKV